MFGRTAPPKRGVLGAPTGAPRGFEDEDFVPDSQADRAHRDKLAIIREGRKMEKQLLQTRAAVATAMINAGGKVNLDAAGIAVMNGGHLPSSGMSLAGCAKQPQEKAKKSQKKKGKKKEKKKGGSKKKKQEKKKKKDKKRKKDSKKKKRSSSSSSSSSSSEDGDAAGGSDSSSSSKSGQAAKKART
mmetsp:Transcript_35634/g.91881  ORF Transcript_35634/g.91881 Transcript_35634/m.91881 type:complete len:186 (-) Transcript_35634:20-577(-)